MKNLYSDSNFVKLDYTANIIPFNKNCVEFNYIVNNTFGEWLKDLRKAQGLSQEDLAKRASVTKSYISKLEKNQVGQPRLHQIEKICKVLGASYEEAKKLLFLESGGAITNKDTDFNINLGDEVRVSLLHGAGMNEEDQKEFVSAFNVAYQIAKQRIEEKKQNTN